MTIKDPPDYVAVDPCLIYGADDLAPENYRRLLQIVGWMWVTKRSGKPLGVKIEELAERWGVAERTAYHTLQGLGAAGYLSIHYSRGYTYLQRGPAITDPTQQAARGGKNTPGEPALTGRERRQKHAGGAGTNRPREAATQQAARGGKNTPGEPATDDIHNPGAMALHETDGGDPFRATPLHTANTSMNVVVDHTLISEDDQQQQTDNTINAAVQRACIEAGFWEDAARELAGDPWVTPEWVQRTVAGIQALKDRGQLVRGRPIGNVLALALNSLRRHWEPAEPGPEAAGRAAGVACPRCYSYPCECDAEGRPPGEQPGYQEDLDRSLAGLEENSRRAHEEWEREKAAHLARAQRIREGLEA